MNSRNISFSDLLNKKISKPVFKHSVFSVLCIIVLSGYILSNSTEHLESRIKRLVEPIADFIIKEELANNTESIKIKIEDFNQNNPPFKISWVSNGEPKKTTVELRNLVFWSYDYHIASVSDYHFGYLKISGNIFSDKKIVTLLFLTLICLLSITASSIINLLPLIKKTPEDLFIKPINNFIDLISKNPNSLEITYENYFNGKDIPNELIMLESKIISLLKTAKENERNEVAIQIIHLSAKLMHDTQSTLLSLEMNLESLMKKLNYDNLSILNSGLNSIQEIRNFFDNYLYHYRNYISQNFSQELLDKISLEDLNHPFLLSSLAQILIDQKKFEWVKNPCLLSLFVDSDSKFCWVNAAPNQVKRMFSNLLNNAYEAISDKNNGVISVHINTDGKNFELSICDNGLGIEEEKINDVLNGLSLKHSGKGLGLSEAKKYMDSLSGNLIMAHNNHQSGITVKLIFPGETSSPWISKEISILDSNTVIVLDDDFSMLSYWENKISDLGIPIKLFSDYQKALKWVEDNEIITSSCTFIADFHLTPDEKINGVQFLSELKNYRHRYLITSHAEKPDVQKLVENLGDTKLIPKSLLNDITFV